MSLWNGRRVICCAGTGGVGKTTVSAAIGMAAASCGRKTLVMTIDPARRLANALGLEDFGNVEHVLSEAQVAEYGVRLQAPLSVMMPDVKRTFDELVERTAPSEKQRQTIFNNRIYQNFSTILAGSLEYASVEKLYEVYASGRYDLIVLDTPPSQNATNFLEAPGKILNFMDSDAMRWVLRSYAAAGRSRFFDWGTNFLMRTLGKLAGGETLRELAEFLLTFQGMYDGFRARARAVTELLRSEELSFVLVTATNAHQIEGMLRFRREMRGNGLPVRRVLVNRVRKPLSLPPSDAPELAGLNAALAELEPEHRETAWQMAREEATLAENDARAVERIRERVTPIGVRALPELRLDVHDLQSLAELHRCFLDDAQETRENSVG